jgi:hypothetical protein
MLLILEPRVMIKNKMLYNAAKQLSQMSFLKTIKLIESDMLKTPSFLSGRYGLPSKYRHGHSDLFGRRRIR